jgi:lysophospholipase L1-like esterase
MRSPPHRTRIIFVGDSLTEWYNWAHRFPDYDVANLGVSGETVDEMLDRRVLIRSRAGVPDFIFLMTGINNILQERYEVNAPYREIIRNFTAWWKRPVVVIQSILPVEYSWISNDTIRDTNRRLQEIAREFDTEYLDVYRSFVDPDGKPVPGLLSDDGVHLATKGYAVWSAEIERFLRERTAPRAEPGP